jgi:hypothetical protein
LGGPRDCAGPVRGCLGSGRRAETINIVAFGDSGVFGSGQGRTLGGVRQRPLRWHQPLSTCLSAGACRGTGQRTTPICSKVCARPDGTDKPDPPSRRNPRRRFGLIVSYGSRTRGRGPTHPGLGGNGDSAGLVRSRLTAGGTWIRNSSSAREGWRFEPSSVDRAASRLG